MQIFTHDASNYELSSVAERRAVIQQVSSWLNQEQAIHIFMEQMGDYIYARSKSTLTNALWSAGTLTLSFGGNSANADNAPVGTEVLIFSGDDEGIPRPIPGFTGGTTISLPVGSP
jgi:hypothetical protein